MSGQVKTTRSAKVLVESPDEESPRPVQAEAEVAAVFRRPEKGPVVIYSLTHEQFAQSELLEYGVAAERAGFDMVWTSDHFQPWQENEGHSGQAWVTMAALTQRTKRLAFGTGVTCPTYRYLPSIVAQTWASLSILAPGRVFLGLGSGEKLNEGAAGGGWGSYEERSARLIEAIDVIRRLWTGEQVRMKGRFWEVDARLYDPPAAPIPIFIAAGGTKSARLAGLYGDGLITGKDSLKSDPGIRSAWEGGAREAGKDPAALPLIVEQYAVVGGVEEAKYGAEKWRFGPKAWEHGYYDNISPVDIQRRAEAEIPLEEVYARWPIGTEADIHVEAIRESAELGASHVVVHTATPNQLHVIDFFGKKVLPALRDARTR